MKPLAPTTPHVIIMVGIPGAGKTAFAEHFAHTFQSPYINPSVISTQIGVDADATEKITQLLFNELLKTNRTLVYEGSTFTKVQRLAITNYVTKAGYRPLIVWVQTEAVEAGRRATSKLRGRERLTEKQFDAALRQFQAPTDSEQPVVISGKHTYATQLKVVLKRIAGTTRPDTPPQQPRVPSGRNIIVR